MLIDNNTLYLQTGSKVWWIALSLLRLKINFYAFWGMGTDIEVTYNEAHAPFS